MPRRRACPFPKSRNPPVLSEPSASPAAPAILVGVDLGLPHFDGELLELGELARTAGLQPVGRVVARRKAPDAALFVGKGRCSACHFGPNFTNGEFDAIGVPYFAEKGRVDTGRHGGIAALTANPFNLLGRYNDDPKRAPGLATRHVEQLHRNWGEFRVPSLRNVARTAPYMHNGSLATLAAVVNHYSEVSEERLHGLPGQSLIRPLRLTPQEKADLVEFLETL